MPPKNNASRYTSGQPVQLAPAGNDHLVLPVEIEIAIMMPFLVPA